MSILWKEFVGFLNEINFKKSIKIFGSVTEQLGGPQKIIDKMKIFVIFTKLSQNKTLSTTQKILILGSIFRTLARHWIFPDQENLLPC